MLFKRLCLFIFLPFLLKSQSSPFPEQLNYTWPDRFANYAPLPDSLKAEDAVILKERIELSNYTLFHRVAVKVLTAKGIEGFKHITLPENFDLSNTPNFNVQGRFKDRNFAFFQTFKIRYFCARVIKSPKKIVELPLSYSSKKTEWLRQNGERMEDIIYTFNINEAVPGDIIEYIYAASIDWKYTQMTIYPQGKFAKLDYALQLAVNNLSMGKRIDSCVVLSSHIPLACGTTQLSYNGIYVSAFADYTLSGLEPIQYPTNALEGNLPSVTITNGFPYTSYSRKGIPAFTSGMGYTSAFLNYYGWYSKEHEEWHDTYHHHIHTFISHFKEDKKDTTGYFFMRDLVDTLNSYTVLSAEDLVRSGYPPYAVQSSERLLRGKIAEEFMYKNYCDIASSRKLNYYKATLADKRHGKVELRFRQCAQAECNLLALPSGNGFGYFLPRYHKLSYFPEELPFYYEDVPCVLVSPSGKAPLKLTRTPSSAVISNSRTETAEFKVNLDSMTIEAHYKEKLSGQFSTLLRPLYAHQPIDSTVEAYYFKKCTDKPLSFNANVSLQSSEKNFPYAQVYHGGERIRLTDRKKISLHGWFSFLYSEKIYPEKSAHDFYVDFKFTDSYNFLFEFNRPVEIENISHLNKTFLNDYFEAKIYFAKQDESRYLLKVSVAVKKDMIPRETADTLREFCRFLDEMDKLEIIVR